MKVINFLSAIATVLVLRFFFKDNDIAFAILAASVIIFVGLDNVASEIHNSGRFFRLEFRAPHNKEEEDIDEEDVSEEDENSFYNQ